MEPMTTFFLILAGAGLIIGIVAIVGLLYAIWHGCSRCLCNANSTKDGSLIGMESDDNEPAPKPKHSDEGAQRKRRHQSKKHLSQSRQLVTALNQPVRPIQAGTGKGAAPGGKLDQTGQDTNMAIKSSGRQHTTKSAQVMSQQQQIKGSLGAKVQANRPQAQASGHKAVAPSISTSASAFTPAVPQLQPAPPAPPRKTIDIGEDADRILDGLPPSDSPNGNQASASDSMIASKSYGSRDASTAHATFTMSFRSVDDSFGEKIAVGKGRDTSQQQQQHNPRTQRIAPGGIRRNPGFEESETERLPHLTRKWL